MKEEDAEVFLFCYTGGVMDNQNKTLDTLKREIFLTKENEQIAEEALCADRIPYGVVKKIMEVGGYKDKINALREAYLMGINFDSLISLVHDSDGSEEVRVIAGALERGLDIQKIQIVADGKHNYKQMGLVFYGFYRGRSIQEMELATDNRFDEEQMEEILSGFQYGLPYDQVAYYAKEEFDNYQMRTIKRAFLFDKLTIEEADVFAKPSNNTKRMRQEIKKIVARRYEKEIP